MPLVWYVGRSNLHLYDAEKDIGYKWNRLNQQCLAAMKGSLWAGASRARHEINCPLVSAGGSQLECCVQFLVLQIKEEVGQTESVRKQENSRKKWKNLNL